MGRKNKRTTEQEPSIAPPGATKPVAAAKTGLSGGKLATIVTITFALAFGMAWLLFTPGPNALPTTPEPATARTEPAVIIGADDVTPFLAAATAEKYSDMERLGARLFVAGAVIPDHATLFEGYAVNSYPSYQVYNFYSRTIEDRIFRVLLTVEDNGTIDSFLAEEMPIVR